jgi:glycosyltransferase involved in cell wall biosynthesis
MKKENSRVAILGNMNNSYFALTRYLREAGYEVVLYQFNGEPKHFTPANDSFNDDYKNFTIFLDWGAVYQLMHVPASKIRKEFSAYDFIIGSGTAPAYLNKAGLTLDLFFAFGWDLYRLPFLRMHNPFFTLQYFYCLFHQRAGIRNAKHMTLGDSSPFFDSLLARLKFTGKRHIFGSPGIYEPDYNQSAIKKNYQFSATYPAYKKIREEYEFVIFHNSRQIWKTKSNPVAIKDNDVFFRAFKRFKEFTNARIALIAFEYGVDFKASQRLCKKLEIQDDVFWMPLSPRKELMVGMSLCDLVAGEFKNSWFTYGVIFESMAVGKPVMHNRIDSLYPNEDLYPMLNATNEEEIFNQLCFAISHKEKLKKMGIDANHWFKKHIVEKTINEIGELINEKITTGIS